VNTTGNSREPREKGPTRAGRASSRRPVTSSVLTAEGFEALLAWLDPDRERAGELYQRIRERLITLFVWRGCPGAEDLADETINRVARRLAEGLELPAKAGNRFFYGVAHRVFQEVLRERERWAREACFEELLAAESGGASSARLSCFERCLAALDAADRRLLIRYHGLQRRSEARKMLSAELGITPNTLRIRVHRIRRRLEERVERCLRGEEPAGATTGQSVTERRGTAPR
jgi:DNA-directed RNA polymerase specialized sigma24 family protein